ncbi:hypothetical protein [Sphingomonas sp. KR3-1]|uniref:hypothetical protein n=1 Tax=Sphingomonas sp. KR3-1 TaxID=3156611 RepID=UPI0032B5A77B
MNGSDRPPASLSSAWLGGAFAIAAFALLSHLGMILVMTSGAALGAALQFAPNFLLYAVAGAGVMMLLLVAIMHFAEAGNTRRSLRAWLIAGLMVSSPLALFGLLAANMGDPVEGAPLFDYRTLIAPAFFLTCGLVGGATAFRIRHRSWSR